MQKAVLVYYSTATLYIQSDGRMRQYTLVKLRSMTDSDRNNHPSLFHDGSEVIFISEIQNKLGYGLFLTKNHTFIYAIEYLVEC